MRRLLLVLVAALALTAPSAHAATFAPPPGKVYTGLSGSTSADLFTRQVDRDVAVFGSPRPASPSTCGCWPR